MIIRILIIAHSVLIWNVAHSAASQQVAPPPKISVAKAADQWRFISFLSDSRRLVTFDAKDGLRTWNAADGQLLTAAPLSLREVETTDSAWLLASDDQVLIVLGGDRPELLRVEIPGGAISARVRLPGRADKVAISPDGTRIALGDEAANAIRVVDVRTRQVLRSLKGPAKTSRWFALAFSRDGGVFGAVRGGYADSFFTAWDLNDGRQIQDVNVGQGSGYALTPDHRRVLLSGKRVRLLDLQTGTTVWEAKVGAGLDPSAPSSEVVATLAGERGVLLALPDRRAATFLSLLDGRVVKEVALPDYARPELALSPDGRTLVATAFGEKTTTWDVDSGRQLARIGSPLDNGLAAVPSGDLTLAVAGSSNGTVLVWDLARGRLAQRFVGSGGFVRRVRTTPDGRFAAAVVVTEPAPDRHRTALRWWSLETGELLRTIEIPGDHDDVALLSDGRRAVFMDGDRVAKLWDLPTGRVLRAFDVRAVRSDTSPKFFVSPDDRLLTVSDNPSDGQPRRVRLFDVATGRVLKTLPGEVWSINALFPNGESLALRRDLQTGRGSDFGLWDAATGALRRKVDVGFEVDRIVPLSEREVLVTAGGGKLRAAVVDLATGRPERAFDLEPGLSELIAAARGRLVASSDDGTLVISERDATAAAVTFYAFADGAWLVITAEGFFNGSEGAAKRLNVIRGVEATSIDQVFQALYRPDLVREKLAGDPAGLVREASTRLNLVTALASGSPPDARLNLQAASGDRQEVEAEIIDRGGGIGRIEWRVNGVTAAVETLQGPAPPAGERRRVRASFALTEGTNLIEVLVYNRAGLVASAPAQISVVRAPSPRPAPSRLFVLAIGLNDYAENTFKLSHSVADADATAKVLAEAGRGFYDGVSVTLLRDAEVVPAKIEAAFDKLSREIGPADTFAFFVAGHGKTIDGRYFFIPQDFNASAARAALASGSGPAAEQAAEQILRSAVTTQGVSQEQWQAWLATIPAKRSLLLFDTCESGTLVDRETQALAQGAASERLARATGRTIITASQRDAEAFEGYRGHGLFTYNVIEAFEQADTDGNGQIEIAELAAYVYARVSSLSESVFRTRQVPQIRLATDYSLARRLDPRSARLGGENGPRAATHRVAQTTDLRVAPTVGGPVVRKLKVSTPITVVRNDYGWALIESAGKTLGYIAAGELAPLP